MTRDDKRQLKAIEARESAATEGPWMLKCATDYEIYRDIDGYPGFCICDIDIDASPDDIAFIAHSRADVPWLIAKVRELEEELTATKNKHDDLIHACDMKGAWEAYGQ